MKNALLFILGTLCFATACGDDTSSSAGAGTGGEGGGTTSAGGADVGGAGGASTTASAGGA